MIKSKVSGKYSLKKASKMCSSYDLIERNAGLSALYDLYKSGNEKAGWELVSWYNNKDFDTGLTLSEAVNLLVSDVEKNQNPFAALDLYYHHGKEVNDEKLIPLLKMVEQGSVTAREILERDFGILSKYS